jgi:hypothetical protein
VEALLAGEWVRGREPGGVSSAHKKQCPFFREALNRDSMVTRLFLLGLALGRLLRLGLGLGGLFSDLLLGRLLGLLLSCHSEARERK